MEENDNEIDLETATDEESLKIRRLENELKSVSSKEDKKLFLWLGLALASIAINKLFPSPITKWLVVICIPLSIALGLGITIFQNIRKKKSILIKHGLQCKSCGFIPHTLNASSVLIAQKCLKCHAELKTN